VTVRILIGDCLTRMKELPDNSVDSVVCDPPYHLTSIVKRFGSPDAAPCKVGQTGAYARASKGFMGQTWDGGDVAFRPETWAEVLRVLKPGGHLVAFSGTRTYHRMAVAIEDAGFEIRDMIAWHYGSGFPKSLDVSKAIDKARVEDAEPIRRVCRFLRAAMDAQGLKSKDLTSHFGDCDPRLIDHWAARDTDSQPHLPTLDQWQTLKSVLGLADEMDGEVWRLNGRKGSPSDVYLTAEVIGEHEGQSPGLVGVRFDGDRQIRERSEAAREWEGWGTALKPATEPICLARKPLSEKSIAANVLRWGTGALNIDGCRIESDTPVQLGAGSTGFGAGRDDAYQEGTGRQYGTQGRWPANLCHDGSDEVVAGFPETITGTIAPHHQRTTSKTKNTFGEREAPEGESFPGDSGSAARFFYCAKAAGDERGEGNDHPTVKPVALMRWLVRLVTPKGGTVLDPFMGSGSTGLACDAEQLNFIGCELSPEYAGIAERRIRDAAGMFADVKVAA
jgi:DNA modification methylase